MQGNITVKTAALQTCCTLAGVFYEQRYLHLCRPLTLMIQRIQTVYLILAALCGILLYFLPLFYLIPGELAAGQQTYRFAISGLTTINNNTSTSVTSFLPLMLMNGFIILSSFFIIAGYKNRPRQEKASKLLMLLVLVEGLLAFYYLQQVRVFAGPGYHYQGVWTWCLFLLQLIFCFLAARAIRKDEKLVRSADRLR